MMTFKIFFLIVVFLVFGLDALTCDLCAIKKLLQYSACGLVLSITKFQACWKPKCVCSVQYSTKSPPSALFSNPSAKSEVAVPLILVCE